MTRPTLNQPELTHDENPVTVTTPSGTHEKHPSALPANVSGTRRAVRFGTYRLFGRLGSGGMADVYLAVSQSAMNVNRLVVIKRLREEQANDPQARDMFLTEARIAARLNHPNVIQTFEAGCENDNFFIAMEYVDGQPLSRLLSAMKNRPTPIDPRLAARICADALNGLHHAHELADFDGTPLELVHRDVSPQNIMVNYDGSVKIVDFGIAKAVGTTQTEHGVFKGKVAYMAPEQVRGDQIDRRADTFAAGIVLWEAITGTRLMADRDPATTLYNLLTKQVPRPSDVNPRVPAELDAILERALKRELEGRYQNARDMRDDLESYIANAGRVRQEEIGDLMKELFAEQRETVQTQIRSQLATLSLRGAADSGRHPTMELSRTQIRQMTNALVPIDDGFVTSPSGNSGQSAVLQATALSAQVPPPARRFGVGALLCVSILALAASGLALLRSQHAPVVVPVATATATPSEAPSAPASSARATATPSETASVPVTTVAPKATPAPAPSPPPPRVVYTPPPRTTPATPSQASTPTPDTTRSASAPSGASTSSGKTQEPPQGRTFRRDL